MKLSWNNLIIELLVINHLHWNMNIHRDWKRLRLKKTEGLNILRTEGSVPVLGLGDWGLDWTVAALDDTHLLFWDLTQAYNTSALNELTSPGSGGTWHCQVSPPRGWPVTCARRRCSRWGPWSSAKTWTSAARNWGFSAPEDDSCWMKGLNVRMMGG